MDKNTKQTQQESRLIKSVPINYIYNTGFKLTPLQKKGLNRLEEIAIGNIEQSLADVVVENGEDSIYSNALTLAFDALMDHGAHEELAATVAAQVAQLYAQP